MLSKIKRRLRGKRITSPFEPLGLYLGLLRPDAKEITGAGYRRAPIYIRICGIECRADFGIAKGEWGTVGGIGVYENEDDPQPIQVMSFQTVEAFGNATHHGENLTTPIHTDDNVAVHFDWVED